ncbi:MAG: SCO family protein [Rhodospirillales bacterium]|nr:SCO family protein [Rhodospirillales bacterium]MCW8862555.1 SCO family protein [Rhodospirillales bacterium]MCW8951459.1 SCO family protein [Rhodospirillales bacterium]MCW8970335.1 SCO family protein [Rhodospirillales bacterium]MCW9001188.1 SCO family protein [Rhodospirillales bacterium]
MDEKAALAFSQASLGRTIRDGRFADHEGNTVTLSSFLGKPLIINFIYTSCYSYCPTLTHSMADAIHIARETFGEDTFNVLTIGFDTGFDTPEAMRQFAKREGQGESGGNWRFLSGGLLDVVQLSDDLGFMFYRTPKGFDHLTKVTVIDAEGVVYRHAYGEKFDPPHIIEPLKDIIYGTKKSIFTTEGLVKRVLFFCTTYDPAAGKYRFDYSIFVGMAAGFSLMWIPGLILYRVWRRKKQDRLNEEKGGA